MKRASYDKLMLTVTEIRIMWKFIYHLNYFWFQPIFFLSL
jgi:hypothetical protein